MGILFSIFATEKEKSAENTSFDEPRRNNEQLCPADETEENSLSNTMNTCITTDAVLPETFKLPVLTIEQVEQLEKDLEYYEMVSLVYLLYDDPHLALQKLITERRCKRDMRSAISDWVRAEIIKKTNWNNRLQEALHLIQNYKILKAIGHQDPRLPSIVQSIKKIKKELYKIYDNLSQEETQLFISIVEKDFMRKGKHFENYDPSLFEMYLLHWQTEKYISEKDLGNLAKVFKQMDHLETADVLQKYCPDKIGEKKHHIEIESEDETTYQKNLLGIKSKKSSKVCDTYRQNSNDDSIISTSSASSGNFSMTSTCDSQYFIDKDNPGVVLIINQQYFYTHPNLLGIMKTKLEDREGSEVDCETLKNTFEFLGFKVIVKSDLPYDEIENVIRSFLEKITNESSVFVCVLSHGEEGIIYTHDSYQVEIQSIINLMGTVNKRNLDKKPKVLLLQSCQGKQVQEVEDKSENIKTDGLSNTTISPTRDMLIFWATVPKYAAIRNEKTGTWFIQSFCNKLREHYKDSHLVEICTRVKSDVSDKKWEDKSKKKIYGMTSYSIDTFRKDFYLLQK